MIYRPNATIKCLLAALLATLLWGCGTSNDGSTVQAPSFNTSGKHPANWVGAHGISYQNNVTQCKECHGADLNGGISNVSCSSGSFSGLTCHSHPLAFKDPALHGPVAKRDLIACQPCHGEAGAPGSNPRFNVPKGSLAVGCESAGCHNRENLSLQALFSAHPVPWPSHGSAGNMANACALCHGLNLGGGVGPKCSACHAGLAAGAVPISGNCDSCHGNPPTGSAPLGSVFPNIPGAHYKHCNLTEVKGICNSCHNGAGSGTANHSNGTVNVIFLTAYDAKSGRATYNSANQKCTNVSCHGGKETPPWQTGAINANTDCTSCHSLKAGNDQYNSYFSGQHEFHAVLQNIPCTDCHDTAKLNSPTPPSHFSGLSTPTFELLPQLTIRTDVNYSGGTCFPVNTGNNFSINVCHMDPRPKSW